MKKAALFILLILPMWSMAQRYPRKEAPRNIQDFERRPVHFGFSLGFNRSSFQLDNDLTAIDSLTILEVQPAPGFNLNIISVLHLSRMFYLRFTPGLAFSERILEYTFVADDGEISQFDKRVESTYIDFPLTLKYRSLRYDNFAAYVLGGFRYSLDLASKKNVDNALINPDEILIKLERPNYNLEIGTGTDFFLEYFKFSIELKYSMGLNNVIIQDGTPFSEPLLDLRSRMFYLTFNFEG